MKTNPSSFLYGHDAEVIELPDFFQYFCGIYHIRKADMKRTLLAARAKGLVRLTWQSHSGSYVTIPVRASKIAKRKFTAGGKTPALASRGAKS